MDINLKTNSNRNEILFNKSGLLYGISFFSLRELAGQEFNLRDLFAEKTQNFDYFFISQMSELNNQPEVKQILYENYQIRQETGDYIIFDLNHKIED